jgi:hypothetical protein
VREYAAWRGVKRCRGHCFAQARCAVGVREILRNTRRPELVASLPRGVSVNGIWCVGDPGRAVTTKVSTPVPNKTVDTNMDTYLHRADRPLRRGIFYVALKLENCAAR